MLATTGGAIPQYGYTGREPDASGLIYYRARYYNPSVGRFTQRDPLGFIDGINRYAYAINNPVNYTDPWGTTSQGSTLSNLWSQGQSYFNTGLDYLQTGLDVVGLGAQGPLEPIGVPVDLANAGISLLRGNFGDAALSGTAAIPFVGIAANTAKIGGKVKEALSVTKSAAQNFDIAPRVLKQLNDSRLGSLAGKLGSGDLQKLANNPSAKRFLDARSGNINVIQEVEGRLLRITTPRDAQKIISVGPIRPNQVTNRINSGDFVPLK